MLSPSMLCDTYTLIRTSTAADDNPFGEGVVTNEITILTRVRLSQSSGDRAVDAQGDTQGYASARQAILFFFAGMSRTNGSLNLPDVQPGDKLVEGAYEDLSLYDTTTFVGDDEHVVADDLQSFALHVEATGKKLWTVKGVKPLKAKSRLHHLEVSLV